MVKSSDGETGLVVKDLLFRLLGGNKDKVDSLLRLAREESFVEGLGLGANASPSYRALWSLRFPYAEFDSCAEGYASEKSSQSERLIGAARHLHETEQLYSTDGKIAATAERHLAEIGYFGFLVPREFGGTGATLLEAGRLIESVARDVCPSLAGLLSIHSCIGAVDPLVTFGLRSKERTAHFLKELASGNRLSGFALTEPGAGSAIDRISTYGEVEGDDILIYGEKLWISNSRYGGILGVVLLIDGVPEVVIAELPDGPTPQFSIQHSGTRALRRLPNNLIRFDGFRVPLENLIVVKNKAGEQLKGMGRAVAYHGLNKGRVALAFNAAGVISNLLGELCDSWVHKRKVFGGELLREQQLVRSQLADAAARAVGVKAVAEWSARLIDQGHSLELEGILAKRLASADQWWVAIEDITLTWGGRGVSEGNSVADNIFDLLVPRIYEGENRVLCLKWMLTVLKPMLSHPIRFAFWYLARIATFPVSSVRHFGAFRWMPSELRSHAIRAAVRLQWYSLLVPVAFLIVGPRKIASQQNYMSYVSDEIQRQIARVVIACYGARSECRDIRLAAKLRCSELAREGESRGIASFRFFKRHAEDIDSLGSAFALQGKHRHTGASQVVIPHDYTEGGDGDSSNV